MDMLEQISITVNRYEAELIIDAVAFFTINQSFRPEEIAKVTLVGDDLVIKLQHLFNLLKA